ncbi:MAG: TonB-dependent receptor [Tannerella sp.]|nr:TonB-dependent receptor [Tannerella sp.]
MLLMISTVSFAQQITVKGTVTDTSEPLIGVSIAVKGATSGTTTDADGNYIINVAPNATLIFSYIGYVSQEIAVNNRTVINVTLSENELALDEVVIVGVSMKKSDLTGAVGSVSSKVLEEKPVTNINQAIQGRVAGVFISNAAKPGDDASIRVRGINTIDGSTDPIYVIDGLVMDNHGRGFSSINLNDVASIEVLKDASSTALYGSRASNGVILITTKKGKAGEGRINYDGWISTQSYAKMPKTMNSRQLFELSRDAAMNSFDALHPDATAAERDAFLQNRVMQPYNGNAAEGYVFSQWDIDAWNNPNFQDYNWLDAVTRDGFQQNHTLSFQGGSDKGSYYLSFGYSNEEGLIKKLSDTKYTGRINAEQSIKKWLKVGTNTSFTRTESQIFNDDGVYDRARAASPTLAITDTIISLPNWSGVPDGEHNRHNPINSLKIDNDRVQNRLVSSNYININPLAGLNIRTSFAINLFTSGQYYFVPNDISEAIRASSNGNVSQTFDNVLNWQWDNSISYDKQIGLHRINALLGTSATKTNRNWFTGSAEGYDTNYFSYYNIGANTKKDVNLVSSDFTTQTLQSYVVRANYNYAGKYYLTATARYDGSSKFAEGHQWGLFPSFSAAWNIAEEDFMKNQTIFDLLKLRAGYGMVGNQNISDFAFLTLYTPRKDGDRTTYVPQGRRGTEDITWESQHQANIGVDFGFLDNRIRLSADYFNITNKNLLMTRSLPTTTGFSSAIENVGAIENKGFEITLDAALVQIKDLEWNFSANFSADRNKVTQLFGDIEAIYSYGTYGEMNKTGNLFLGESRNSIFILKSGGIAQEADMAKLSQIEFAGKNVNPGDLYPLDLSGPNGTPDGIISDMYDRVIVGSTDPKFYGGFSSDVTYKGLTLNAVFTYSYGAKKISYMYESLIGSNGRSPASVDLLDRWSPTNTDAAFPRPIYNPPGENYNVYSAGDLDQSIQDGSFLRLSNLTLAYSLPSSLLSKAFIGSARIYTTASNLFILTPYKGYDPETGDWYPPTRLFTFGLNLSF